MTEEAAPQTEIKDLSANVAVTPDLRIRIMSAESALKVALTMEINSADDLQFAVDERNAYLKSISVLDAEMDKVLLPAKTIMDTARGWFKPGITSAQAAVKHLNGLITAWTEKEQQRIALENKAREEEQRKARQRAEQEAAAAVAEAEERAREQRRVAEEAEQRRQAALQAGNAKEAAEAAATAAKAQERAAHAVETGQARAQEATLRGAVTAPAPLATAPAVVGNTMRKNWQGELKPNTTAEQAKLLILEAIIVNKRTDLLGIVDIDEKSINKMAKALESNMDIPGYVAKNNPIAAGSKK